MSNFKKIRVAIKETEKGLRNIELQPVAEKARDLVFNRVKSGVGVNDDNAERPRAKRLKKLASGRKSTLTDTGQMLDNLVGNASRNTIRVFVKDNTREESDRTNAEVADFVRKDRPFLALTGIEQDIIDEEVTELLENKFRKLTK